jgi:hypothetical protein
MHEPLLCPEQIVRTSDYRRRFVLIFQTSSEATGICTYSETFYLASKARRQGMKTPSICQTQGPNANDG